MSSTVSTLRTKFQIKVSVLPLCAVLAIAQGLCSAASAQTGPSRFSRGFNQTFQAASKPIDGLNKVEAKEGDESTPIPGTTLYTGAAAFGGYESNLDMLSTAHKGAAFGGTELGLGAIVTKPEGETTVAIRGAYLIYDQDFRPERWDGGAYLDHHAKIGDGVTLTLGGFYFRDEVDFDRNQRFAGYATLEKDTDNSASFVRWRSLYRNYLNAVGAILPAGRLTEVNSSFSNIKTELAFGTMLMKDQRIAPYIQVGAALVDFTDQIDTAVLNRNSRDAFAIGGVRVKLMPDLFADLGVRYNNRQIDDPTIKHHDSAFFDGKLVWEASKSLNVEFNVDRTNQDPLTASALFSEDTSARVTLAALLDDKTRLSLEGGIVRRDQIGANLHFDEQYVESRLTHTVMPNAAVFVFGKYAHDTDSLTKATAENAQIGIGFKIKN